MNVFNNSAFPLYFKISLAKISATDVIKTKKSNLFQSSLIKTLNPSAIILNKHSKIKNKENICVARFILSVYFYVCIYVGNIYKIK